MAGMSRADELAQRPTVSQSNLLDDPRGRVMQPPVSSMARWRARAALARARSAFARQRGRLPMPISKYGICSGRSNPSIASLYLAALVAVMAAGADAQTPCNPAIDGTYCATAGIPNRSQPAESTRRDGLGSAVSGTGFYEQPATLGAITFGSNGRCIGLVRRVNCKD
jgi:hypothetical protein